MAAFVFTDAHISINGVDLSDHVERVEIHPANVDLVEATRMGNTGELKLASAIKDGSLTVRFQQDFAASKTDATLWAAVGIQVPIVFRPVKGTAIGATNPEYRFQGLMDDYPVVAQDVKQLATVTVTFRNADGVAPTRNIV